MIAAMILSAMIATTHVQEKPKTQKEWKPIGEQRITCYCPQCNDGQGYESSSGKRLRYGHAACSWLSTGTKISVEGEIFTVVDICGTDAIDIFIDTDSCECNINEYRRVSVLQ